MMTKYILGKNLKNDVCMIYITILHNNFDSFLRCHESARIFCNVLERYGYDVEVIDGFYVYDKKKLMHSWVEFFDAHERKIIETTPQQVYTKISSKKVLESLVISQHDQRFARYHPLEEEFLESCKKNNIQIYEKQVEQLSERISQLIKKTVVKKKDE